MKEVNRYFSTRQQNLIVNRTANISDKQKTRSFKNGETLWGNVTRVGEESLRCYVIRIHQCQSEGTHGSTWAVKVASFETDVYVFVPKGA